MHISWLGQSAFKIEFKNGAEDGLLLFDPYKHPQEELPRSFSPDLVLLSRGNKDVTTLSKEPFIIDEAGEYEFKQILVYSWQVVAQKKAPLIFRTEIEHVAVVHLGLLNAPLCDELIGELSGTDILLLPVGGAPGLSPERAAELVTAVEPRLVIPYAYKAPGTGAEYLPIEKFLKAIGQTAEPQPKIKINKRDLPQDQLQVILLEKV